jgi:ribosomal protein S18 acetylase RimI-like enzyme
MMAPIRVAARDDFDEVLALWRQDAAFATATDDLDGLGALCARDGDALLVADDGGRIVGTVIAAWDGWRGGIYRLVVASTHRRRGLGRTLVDAAVKALAARGARRIAAVVDGDDEQAMAFWRAMAAGGFEHDAAQERFAMAVSER